MDFTSIYHQVYLKETRYDESASRGAGFQSPYFVFEFEIIVLYTKRLTFYLIRLMQMGIRNEKIEADFVKIFSSGILNVEYTQEKFLEFVTTLYFDMLQAREMYISVCQKNNLEIETFKPELKDPRKLGFLDLIKKGQKYFLSKYKNLTAEDMNYFELHIGAFKSVAIHFIELKILGIRHEMVFNYVLLFLSTKKENLKGKLFQDATNLFLELNNNMLQQLYEVKKERYGELETTKIPASRRRGKAILVAGPNLRELELVLEATKDKGIDVYTHGNMLIAHAYPKFKTYPHFIGHFSEEKESYLIDFLNFPGSILLTRFSYLNVEGFYHGRIYTTDEISTPGVGLIKDYNFEPLIQSAIQAEGFNEEIEKIPIKFNFSEKEFSEKITEIAEKIESGKIKHLLVIGTPTTKLQQEYFDKLLSSLGKDCFAFSFSFLNQGDNVLNIESDYAFTFFYKVLQVFTRKISIEQLNPIFLFTSCEIHTFTNIAYMKLLGVKKIYLPDCPVALVNPNFTAFIRKIFNVKNYTTPENDLKEMLPAN